MLLLNFTVLTYLFDVSTEHEEERRKVQSVWNSDFTLLGSLSDAMAAIVTALS